MTTLDDVLGLDDQLAATGVPRIGAWWRDELGKWYASPARTFAACAGRGSAKSTVLYKLALAETLLGDYSIPPGERHWASITSRHRDEAGKAIGIIGGWLRLLGVAHDATTDAIEVAHAPRGIRITAASVGGNTGWRSFWDGADEVAKWPMDGAIAVDAAEVLASKAAMTATHPTARRVLMSTPFLDAGPFYELIAAGTTERVFVAGPAPTWIASDGRVTEAMTHALEPSARVHAREYGASFAAAWSDGYFADLVAPCVQSWTSRPYQRGQRHLCAIDPAFARDLFAIVVCHVESDRVVVDFVEAIAPPRNGENLSPSACMRRVHAIANAYRVRVVLSDQHHAQSLVEIAQRERVTLDPIAWTTASKQERFDLVRGLMADRRLVLPNDRGLLRELASIGTRLRSGGGESIEARRGATDDRVAALVLAVSSATTRTATPGARLVNALRRGSIDRLEASMCRGDIRNHPQFDEAFAYARAAHDQWRFPK